MKGNTVNEFIDDILTSGGPEKEFIFRNKFYFLETLYNEENSNMEQRISEDDRPNPADSAQDRFVKTHIYTGKNFAECTEKFETARIFDGQTIYEAEPEIEVLFGYQLHGGNIQDCQINGITSSDKISSARKASSLFRSRELTQKRVGSREAPTLSRIFCCEVH